MTALTEVGDTWQEVDRSVMTGSIDLHTFDDNLA